MAIQHRGPLDLSSFDHTLKPDDESSAATIIDLTRVTFVDAYGLVGLACYIAAADGEGRSVQLRLPVSEELQTYLARMHLGPILDRYGVEADGSLPEVRELDRRDRLIELRSFRDVHGSEQLAAFSIPDRGRGQGLTSVVEGVRDLGGTVRIRTGGASRSITRRTVEAADRLLPLQGTIVGARLPCRPSRVTRAEGGEEFR